MKTVAARADLQERRAQQRPGFQIERLRGVLAGESQGRGHRVCVGAQILVIEGKPAGGMNFLMELGTDHRERGANGFVPLFDVLQGARERITVELSLNTSA